MKVKANGDMAVDDCRSPNLVSRRWASESEKHGSVACWESLKKWGIGIEGKGKAEKIGGDDGIKAVRAKLIFGLQLVTDKIKVTPFKEGEEEDQARPWNLRTWKAACKDPLPGDGEGKS